MKMILSNSFEQISNKTSWIIILSRSIVYKVWVDLLLGQTNHCHVNVCFGVLGGVFGISHINTK